MLELSGNEKKVFYGLVKWPDLTDLELAGKLEMNRSTVTSIRNRLESKKAYSTHNVPDLEGLGCEVLGALYGEFHPHAGHTPGEELRGMFFMVSMGAHKLALAAANTFTDMKKHIEDYHRSHPGDSRKKHNYALFPLKMSYVHRFFDYSPLLKEHFGLDLEEKEEKKRRDKVALSGREKEVFSAMLRHPALSDSALAGKVGMSRQTVSGIKSKLTDAGLIRKVRVPDLSQLGYELLAFTHLHHDPRKKEEIGYVSPRHILKVDGDLESVTLSAYKDYTDYWRSHGRVLERMHQKGMLLDEPAVKLFSLQEASLELHHRYSPLAEDALTSTE